MRISVVEKTFLEWRELRVSGLDHPLPVNGNTKWIMLTFDGTAFYGWTGQEPLDYGTHGDFYVMDGPTWERYSEF